MGLPHARFVYWGSGLEQIVDLPTDAEGRLRADALEKALADRP